MPARSQAVLPSGEMVAQGLADQFKFGPSHAGLGNARLLHTVFTRTLVSDKPSAQALLVRAAMMAAVLPRSDST